MLHLTIHKDTKSNTLSSCTIPEKLSRLFLCHLGNFKKNIKSLRCSVFSPWTLIVKKLCLIFFSKIISAGQAQLKNVFSYYQPPEHAQDFCTIQMSKEHQVFNSLAEKLFLSWNVMFCIKQASSHTVEISGEAVLHYTGLGTCSFSPWHRAPKQCALVRLPSTVADFNSPSPLQVLEEPSIALSQLNGLLLIVL